MRTPRSCSNEWKAARDLGGGGGVHREGSRGKGQVGEGVKRQSGNVRFTCASGDCEDVMSTTRGLF